jgi:hypothetical protein|tara:strand:+ start:179 stop:565 length:387 start_codon:yes stop_codon:yes gene_type:complete
MKDRLSKLSILVVNYKYDLRDDNDPIEAGKNEEVAAVFRNFPGLGIKFGIANQDDENEYGGIYLFEDDASLEAFLASPILKEFSEHPDVSELTYKKYNAAPDFTKNTITPGYISGEFINDLKPAGQLV